MKFTKGKFNVRFKNRAHQTVDGYIAEGGKVGFYKVGSVYEVLHLATSANCGRTRTIANAKKLAALFIEFATRIDLPMDETDEDKLRVFIREAGRLPFLEARKEFCV